MSDIIQLLEADHREVQQLLGQLTSGSGGSDALQTFKHLHQSLRVHMKFEEERIYPLLIAKRDSKDAGLEAVEEHRQAKTLLNALAKMSSDDEPWEAKLTVLSEDIQHHVKEEESTVFSKLKQVASEETLATLGEEYQRAKERMEARVGRKPVPAGSAS